MIVLLKKNINEEDINALVKKLKELFECEINSYCQSGRTVLFISGANIPPLFLAGYAIVDEVVPLTEPRLRHPREGLYAEPVAVGDLMIGGGNLTVIAGPCTVESEEQIMDIAALVKKAGAHILRGGSYKLRHSPYAFQGMGEEGLRLLAEAGRQNGLPIISEITSPVQAELFAETSDILQIGARNMYNFELLKEVGKTLRPVLLKRGLSATIEEWLRAAEYIWDTGNHQIILCERGIRTFEPYTRNTLDLGAVCAAKRLSGLPVLVDPSHACGISWMVEPLSLAAVVAGADGIMVEVHNDPTQALCDAQQALDGESFAALMKKVAAYAPLCGRSM